MTQFIETTGRTQEDAIQAALDQLGLERDDVSVEVVDRPKAGFLGFGGNPAKVRITYDDGKEEVVEPVPEPEPTPQEPPAKVEKPPEPPRKPEPEKPVVPKEPSAPKEKKAPVAKGNTPPTGKNPSQKTSNKPKGEGKRSGQEAFTPDEITEISHQIKEFLTGLFVHLNVEATPEITATPAEFQVKLTGENLGVLIGRRGETLDSIQQLTSYVVNKGQTKRVRIFLDAENYREKREETLKKLAGKVAGEAVKHRRNVVLESMNAYERHIIHAALQDVPNISTYSTGSDPNRRTVVCYNGKKQ